MNRQPLYKRLGALAAGLALAAAICPSEAKGQTNEQVIVNWAGTVNAFFGTGNGVPDGAAVSGSITYNPANFVQISASNPGFAGYDNATAYVTVDVSSSISSSQGISAWVYVDSQDFSNPSVPCDSLLIAWGPGDEDGFNICSSLGTITGVSASGITCGQWWANNLSNPLDIVFVADIESGNGVEGTLSSFTVTIQGPTPNASRSGTNLTLSWTTNTVINYQLVQSSSLLGTNWISVTNTPVVTNGLNVVSLSPTNKCEFFRLQGTN
jgi:hypothetical protein